MAQLQLLTLAPVAGTSHLRPGGGLKKTPTISKNKRARKKDKTVIESSSKMISKILRSFFLSGQYQGHQRSK